VDDESIEPPEVFKAGASPPPPREWTGEANPPYSYWMVRKTPRIEIRDKLDILVYSSINMKHCVEYVMQK
jgi:hypothetical protein